MSRVMEDAHFLTVLSVRMSIHGSSVLPARVKITLTASKLRDCMDEC